MARQFYIVEWLRDCILDTNNAHLVVSDVGSSVTKKRNKNKKKIKARHVINSSDDDDDDDDDNEGERVESRSVLNGRMSEVEQTRSMLWAQASDQGFSVNNSR